MKFLHTFGQAVREGAKRVPPDYWLILCFIVAVAGIIGIWGNH